MKLRMRQTQIIISSGGIPRPRGQRHSERPQAKVDMKAMFYERRFRMKKLTYVKPKVVGSANVHPC